jgi:hypothetical protein
VHADLSQSSAPVNQPFRRPQTKDYLKRICHIAVQYLSMILRSPNHPIEHFPVHLSKDQLRASKKLKEAAAQGLDLLEPIHRLCWALLKTNPPEMMENDRLCPIRRFLVAHFLQENGKFIPVQYMTTDFSKLLFFFRCVACYHLVQHGPSRPEKYLG